MRANCFNPANQFMRADFNAMNSGLNIDGSGSAVGITSIAEANTGKVHFNFNGR